MTYTEQELQEMKTTDPDRYFFFSREEEFHALGIQLDDEIGWEGRVYIPQRGHLVVNNETRFQCFRKAMEEGLGVYALAGDKTVKRVSYTGETKENGEKTIGFCGAPEIPVQKPVIPKNKPVIPQKPEPLGFFFHLRRVLSLGIWGGERSRQHREAMQQYEAAMVQFKEEQTALEKAAEQYSLNKDAYKEAREAHPEMYDAYDLNEAYMERAVKILPEKKNQLLAQAANNVAQRHQLNERRIPERRAWSMDVLDILLGPSENDQSYKEKEGKVQDYLSRENGVLDRATFVGRNRLTVRSEKLTPHQIALAGFAAFCSKEILDVQVDPQVPEEERVGNRTNTWYNTTEGLFFRGTRPGMQFITKKYLESIHNATQQAVTAYNEGDPSLLGHYLKEGIERCVGHVVSYAGIDESNVPTSAYGDYCAVTRELMGLVDSDPGIRKAAEEAGLTPELVQEARLIANYDVIWQRGLEGRNQLLYQENLSPEEKLAAATDVANWGLLAEHIGDANKVFTNSQEYRTAQGELETRLGELQSERAEKVAALEESSPEYRNWENYFQKETQKVMNQIMGIGEGSGNSWGELGFHLESTPEQRQLFGGGNKPEMLREQMKQQLAKSDLMQLNGKDLAEQLSGKNLEQNLGRLTTQKSVPDAQKTAHQVQKGKSAQTLSK